MNKALLVAIPLLLCAASADAGCYRKYVPDRKALESRVFNYKLPASAKIVACEFVATENGDGEYSEACLVELDPQEFPLLLQGWSGEVVAVHEFLPEVVRKLPASATSELSWEYRAYSQHRSIYADLAHRKAIILQGNAICPSLEEITATK